MQQTYKKVEIILINDGSTDNTGALCNELAKKDLRVRVLHQENHGPAHARNLGIKHARGEFIQFIDADDKIAPDMTEKLVHHIQTSELVVCAYKTENEQYIPPITGHLSKQELLQYFGLLYKQIILSSPCNKLYLRKLITERKLLFPVGCNYGEDLQFNLNYLQHCESIYFMEDVLYFYQKNDQSLTHLFIPDLFQQQLELNRLVYKFLQSNNGITEDNQKNIAIAFANHVLHTLSNIFRPNSPMNRAEQRSFIKQIMTHRDVINVSPYFSGSLLANLFKIAIKYRGYYAVYLLFSLKESLRKYHFKSFEWLRKLNFQRG